MKKHGNHGEEREEMLAREKYWADVKGEPYSAELTQWLAQRQRADDE